MEDCEVFLICELHKDVVMIEEEEKEKDWVQLSCTADDNLVI